MGERRRKIAEENKSSYSWHARLRDRGAEEGGKIKCMKKNMKLAWRQKERDGGEKVGK